jgi:hypothetical protein
VTRIVLGITLCLTIAGSVTFGLLPSGLVDADGSQSVHVVKYASDNTTVLAERTLTYAEMEAGLPVQGDGATHYWMQGPTFDPGNLWDPSEDLNLKDKGALKGTDLKDLCDLAGGMSVEDVVEVKAVDGLSKEFLYGDVYLPEPRQGALVVCWWKDGSYVPTFEEGMQLVFFPQTANIDEKYVFGNQDMHDNLPQANWHYFYQGTTAYPSSNGLSVKNVSQINIFSTNTGEIGTDKKGVSLAPAEFTVRNVPLHEEAYGVSNNLIVKNYENKAYLFSISAQVPPHGSARDGYEPIPDSSWVHPTPASSFVVEPDSYTILQLSISIPPDEEYASQKWEVWIAVEQIEPETEMIGSVMVARMKIETASEISPRESNGGGGDKSHLWYWGLGIGSALLALFIALIVWSRTQANKTVVR